MNGNLNKFGLSVLSLLAGIMLLLTACQNDQALKNVASDPVGRTRALIQTPLKPFKDRLFAYRQALEIRDGGDFLRAPYDEQKDINKRDEVPVRKVRAAYIKRIAPQLETEFQFSSAGRNISVLGVGKINSASTMTLIYLHGKNGNRKWGFDDERFGGNYNRVKNLMLENGGAYLSPDFTDFSELGEADIAVLIARQRNFTTGKLILACGSLGSNICWGLANNKTSSAMLDGIILLGGFPDSRFIHAGVKIPLYIAHGSRDKTSPAQAMEVLYTDLRSTGHPVRMTLFETGNHGTPVRMIDWRQALNWIASQ